MCGITGIFTPAPTDLGAARRMRDRLTHRGPDDEGDVVLDDGRVILAQRRLAIIELGPNGRQPMSNENDTIWVVFNGEIYNFAELRDRLIGLGHRFRTHSDTETIVHAYEEWGDDFVLRFRGMFAIALWDGNRRRLVLARDHTGIKPLFYYWDGETFAFASEIKAFWALPELDQSEDRSAIFDYLTYMYVPAPKTAYRYVRKVLPAHTLVFSGDRIEQKRYWSVGVEADPALTESRATTAVREQLAESIGYSMVSDVPVGAFLSGGLDSSTVVAFMAEQTNTPVRTFSIDFDVAGYSETEYARVIAERFHTEHHERTVGRSSIRTLLGRVSDMYDEPYCDGSAMPTLRVSELARDHVKVALSGDGGDEVFAGYRWYDRWLRQRRSARGLFAGRHVAAAVGRAWPDGARGVQIKHFLEGLSADPLGQYARQLELLTPEEKRAVLGPDWAAEFRDYDDYWYFQAHWREDADPLTRVQYLDLMTYLPDDILTKVDRAAMAVGLEVRPPLLDPPLIELAFRIPSAVRYKAGDKKHILKLAMADRLPAEIIHRGKKGFSSPLMDWVAAERPWIESYFGEDPVLLGVGSLQRLGRRLHGPKVWALLLLEEWARRGRGSSVLAA